LFLFCSVFVFFCLSGETTSSDERDGVVIGVGDLELGVERSMLGDNVAAFLLFGVFVSSVRQDTGIRRSFLSFLVFFLFPVSFLGVGTQAREEKFYRAGVGA
jgi:hypothetical protein